MKLIDLCQTDALVLRDIHLVTFDVPWSLETFEVLLNDPTCCGWMVMDGTAPVGFVLVRIILDQSEILTISVLPEYRQKGMGRILMEAYFSSLMCLKVKQAFLEVDVNNVAAIHLYTTMGFEEISIRPNYYDHPDGSKTSAKVMRLIF